MLYGRPITATADLREQTLAVTADQITDVATAVLADALALRGRRAAARTRIFWRLYGRRISLGVRFALPAALVILTLAWAPGAAIVTVPFWTLLIRAARRWR